jgi:hypothetical protein
MIELKAGDVIDVVDYEEDCEGCVFCEHCAGNDSPCYYSNGIKFVLRTGLKQGDTVWGKKVGSDKWEMALFISEFRNGYVLSVPCGFQFFHEMTTEDPYALKYELTRDEARIECVKGNKVRGEEFDGGYITFVPNNGLIHYYGTGDEVEINDLRDDLMYAIVEE